MTASPTVAADFEELFRNAPCGYLSVYPDMRIARLNATLAGWLGFDVDALIAAEIAAVPSVASVRRADDGWHTLDDSVLDDAARLLAELALGRLAGSS